VSEPADEHLLDTLFGTLIRPRKTFAEFAGQRSARPGATAIAVLGMFWGLFSFLLWSSGRSPHAVLLPVPPQHYYLFQGLVMLPLLTALWWLYSEVSHRLAGGTPEAGTRAALGFAYAVPMTVHIGVEMLAYLLLGFDELALVAMISLPLASLWVWALSSLALRELHHTPWPRAIAAAFAGLLVQAVSGSLILR